MADQGDLFKGFDHAKTVAFKAYHEANPGVYAELRSLALNLLAKGRKRYGLMALLNVVRWNRAMTIAGSDPFKVNNNFAPYYARLIMANEPRLAGFFSLRESAADDM